MNGRIYDPLLGRFLSADLQVQFPGDLQNFNRYSYVHNTPLRFTAPSGFGIIDEWMRGTGWCWTIWSNGDPQDTDGSRNPSRLNANDARVGLVDPKFRS